MRWLLAVLFVVGCGDPATPTQCTTGETRPCYTGVPASTENVGICAPGVETCSGGVWPGVCLGDVTPRVEHCNDIDEDCNGVIDDVEEAGNACSLGGCVGARGCKNGKVVCFAPTKNECDLCDGPVVDGLDDNCAANGCFGKLVCTSDGRAAECNAPVQNECGVCGGVAVTGLGIDCMSTDSCTGTTVCAADGLSAVCGAPLKNECMLCGGPPVAGVGGTCSGDHGCVGVGSCNGTNDGLLCTEDSTCVHLVISEVASGSSVCATDEIIELYNPSLRTVSLAGYTLRYRGPSSSTFTRLVLFASTATIAPHGFFLVVSNRSSTGCSNSPDPGGGYPAIPGNTVVQDATYSAQLASDGGEIWLIKADADPSGLTDVNVVDMVGYGTASVHEGTAASAPNQLQGSIERKANASSTAVTMAAGGTDETAGNAYDTNDNAADFVVQTVRAPQNTASTPEP